MPSQTVFVIFIFTVLLVAVSSQGEYGQVYCGRRLAMALAFICDDTSLVKRSGEQREVFRWPWISAQQARSLGRSKRQVVSECCDKPCTIDELLSYCSYSILN
ncbi:unnamed protein product [Parnassius mnemosyne]|uniref:Insulin-like domain-containing protein n=1 Tax=Parnassius mnemosyne TaxID=213953 RepID=A0AAV1KA44_9NEOP